MTQESKDQVCQGGAGCRSECERLIMSDETKDKHTPGPWLWKDSGLWADADFVHTAGTPEFEANARMIAAAPDLLAALEHCVEAYEDELQENEAWQMLHVGNVDLPPTPSHIMHARAAIDKARNGA